MDKRILQNRYGRHEDQQPPVRPGRSLISATTRVPDSRAPFIHPFHGEVCSPAKWILPSGVRIDW
jgi:hypothetical protein